MSLTPTRTLLLASAALVVSLAPAAHAQKVPDLPQAALPDPAESERLDNKRVESRLQREEKALRDLRQIVLKAQAQGNPVVVRPDGPDPAVDALRTRIGDLEETLRRQTGQMEETAHNAQVAAQAAKDASDTNRALSARVDRLEQVLQSAGAAALGGGGAPQQQFGGAPQQQFNQAGPPPQGGDGGGTLGTLRGAPGGPHDIQADPNAGTGRGGRVSARVGGDQGGGDQSAGAPDEATAYKAARQTLDSGDYVGGAAALQDYLQRYPKSARAGEANYWLGRTLALRSMHAEAAGAYARALGGWPKTSWAGDAVIRLSASLVEVNRKSDACAALGEFDTRYAATAAAAVKTRAREAKAQAGCR